MLDAEEAKTHAAVERLDIHNSSDRLQVALHRQRYDFALEHLGRSESVLEIGTGVGSFSPLLADRCEKYAGIEIDRESCLAAAKRLGGEPRIVCGEAARL